MVISNNCLSISFQITQFSQYFHNLETENPRNELSKIVYRSRRIKLYNNTIYSQRSRPEYKALNEFKRNQDKKKGWVLFRPVSSRFICIVYLFVKYNSCITRT